jgi:hypothetical protein
MVEIQLFDSDYLGFFNDGTIGISDGVGYVGEIPADEVRELFKVMQKFYDEQEYNVLLRVGTRTPGVLRESL